MRSIFGAAALLIGCMMMSGCSSVNSGCNMGGGCDAGMGSYMGGGAPCQDAAYQYSGAAGGGCGGCASGQCQVGKSMFSKGFSLPAFPTFDYISTPASGAAVGSCASQACGGSMGGLGGFGGGGCGLGGGGCGLGGAGCGLGGGGCGLGGGGGLGSGKLGQKFGAMLPFAGLRGINHPYGKQPPHTADASVGMQAPGGGQAPSYAYPYYTTRGPRDFLQDGCGPPPIMGYSPRRTCMPSIGF